MLVLNFSATPMKPCGPNSQLKRKQVTCEGARAGTLYKGPGLFTLKGGDPAARSRTATLLRLHPSHKPHRGKRPPEG